MKNAGLNLNPTLIYSKFVPKSYYVSNIWSNLTF